MSEVREYDPIRHLANTVFPDDVLLDASAPRLMFMVGNFTLYFDESCSHPPAPLVYTVAGYLATDVQWRKFRKEWRRILEGEGLDHFHMVKFQACKPPYDAWSKEKRIHFLASLHSVIHKRTLMSFATTANIEDFNSLTLEQQRDLISPHVFAAKNCLKGVGFWAASNIVNHPVIAYIFEEGQPHQRQLSRLVDSLTDEDKSFFRMASLSFAGKKSLNPLQSADVVAYEASKEATRRLDPDNPRRARLSGLNLASDPSKNIWRYCGRQDFLDTLRDAELRAKDYATRHATSAS
ncbi:MAG: DUF3800 domain-containing protein [Pyrinomonadaceae bacterium]